MSKKHITFLQIMLIMVVLTMACGIFPNPDNTTPVPDPINEPTPTVSGLDRAKQATIRIVATGSFETPGTGEILNVPGQGSGFIIDPSGIAVTNNHVVTGSAYREVWVGNEKEPRGAKILGVSECSDLAIIDIDGDGPFPHLEWYDNPIETGLDVYALGFPLAGNTELTVNRGIVSQVQANITMSSSAVDQVIEHDALINPGNSGGPLVDVEQGRVVGVNYAKDEDYQKYFAIAHNEAAKIIEELRQGSDVDSLGINGQAVRLVRKDGKDLSGIGVKALPGIWVASVRAGSPAGNASLEAGDVLFKLQGLLLATDGTMNDYCKVLRSRIGADATLSVVVYRTKTAQCLKGEINGDELEEVDCKTLISLNGGSSDSTGPTPTPAIIAGIVTTDRLNLRQGPGTGYQSVDNLNTGDEVTVLRRNQTADWLVVATSDGQKGGWANAEFIKIIAGDVKNLPVDADAATSGGAPAPTAAPSACGGGLSSFRLWGPTVSCSLAASQDKWYYFDSGQDNNTATLIAFMRNAEQVDMFIYNGNDIPNWPPNFSELPPNMGAGTEQGNRDGDVNTREFIWEGPISQNTRYYLRFVNRGNNTIRYCFVSRPDGATCSP